MVQVALTPPTWPTLPAQRLGSISLCGGARSTCAQPQSMSCGKNIRSPLLASCQVPCEVPWEAPCELSWEPLLCALRDVLVCAPARTEIIHRTVTVHASLLISPPRVRSIPDKKSASPETHVRAEAAVRLSRAEHCNLRLA